MREKVMQQAIITLAKLNGWLVYHTHDSRKSERGFPDLVMVHPDRGECLFVELKSETGKLTPSQGKWLEALLEVKARPRTYLWRPVDWQSGLIESLLRFRRVEPVRAPVSDATADATEAAKCD